VQTLLNALRAPEFREVAEKPAQVFERDMKVFAQVKELVERLARWERLGEALFRQWNEAAQMKPATAIHVHRMLDHLAPLFDDAPDGSMILPS